MELIVAGGGREAAASAARTPIRSGQAAVARSWRRLLTPALTGLFGVALLALAVPHTVGTFLLLHDADTVAAVRQGRPLAPSELDDVVTSRSAAARWIGADQPWSDIARARLARLRDANLSPIGRRDALAAAEAAFRRSLALVPANAMAWAQLAYARIGRSDYAGAGEALELSIASGGASTGQVLWRAQLALQHWPHLDRRTRELFQREFILASMREPEALARMATQTQQVEVIRNALAGNFSLQQRFDELVGYNQRPDLPQDRYERESAFGTLFEEWLFQFDY